MDGQDPRSLLPQLAPFYAFAGGGRDGTYSSGVRGPEYHPAIELLTDNEDRVVGARGHALRAGVNWSIAAGAGIMATGGCAFRSGLIGSHCNNGDGCLTAVEAGAELLSMQFSIAYSLSPAWASIRTLPYSAARYLDEGGAELDIPAPTC